MNLILISENDFIDASGIVRLTGRRHKHILEILKAKPGHRLCVGLVNGKIGEGRVVKIDGGSLEMQVTLTTAPLDPLPLTLVLALPRPQVIKRVLLCASSLGIKKIVLLNFFRVEKSLWQSSSLQENLVREQLILGLEQAKDTVLPEVVLKKSFKRFADDELPEIIRGSLPLAAHPGSTDTCPRKVTQPVTLVIGPEGGFIDFELKKLISLGFRPIDLGERILRVESVVPYAVGKLF